MKLNPLEKTIINEIFDDRDLPALEIKNDEFVESSLFTLEEISRRVDHQYSFKFTNCHFHDSLHVKCRNKLEEVGIKKHRDQINLIFDNCQFKGKVHIDGGHPHVKPSFQDCSFSKKLYFTPLEGDVVNMMDCTADDLTVLVKNYNKCSINLASSTFSEVLVYNESGEKGLHGILERSSFFKVRLSRSLSFYSLSMRRLTFTNCQITDTLNFVDCNISQFEQSALTIGGHVDIIESYIEDSSRSGYSFLKHYASKKGDTFYSIYYRSLDKRAL